MDPDLIKKLIADHQIEGLLSKLQVFLQEKPSKPLQSFIFQTILSELYLNQYKLNEIPDDLLLLCFSEQEVKSFFVDFILSQTYKNIDFIQYIGDAYFDYVVKASATQLNVTMIKILIEIYGKDRVASSLSKQKIRDIAYFESLPAPETTSLLVYQFQKLGKMTCDGVRLTCAEVKERKKDYEFSPVVCEDVRDLQKLCALINDNSEYVREHPVTYILVHNKHFLSGQIRLTPDGKMDVLIMDSLGYSPSQEQVISADVIKIFVSEFSNLNLYYSEEKRQNNVSGCAVFAIDDARHLQTTERYLPGKYKNSGLFGYLSDHAEKTSLDKLCKKEKQTETQSLFFCRLPFHLKRAWQSTALLGIASESIVNKAGQKESSAIIPFFKPNLRDGKLTNTRIESQFAKMYEQNIKFLTSHTDKECLEAMKEFTVTGFQSRLENAHRASLS